MQITDAAVFYSRLTKWDDQFDGLAPHIVSAQLYYSLAFASLELPHGAGHFVADIAPTLETKLAAVRCYKTQFPPAKSHVFDRIRAVAEHHGRAAGFQAGELFTSPKTLGTTDVLRYVLGE
jgi:LmbE family N-acetylglucosaminyl deacetylase